MSMSVAQHLHPVMKTHYALIPMEASLVRVILAILEMEQHAQVGKKVFLILVFYDGDALKGVHVH